MTRKSLGWRLQPAALKEEKQRSLLLLPVVALLFTGVSVKSLISGNQPFVTLHSLFLSPSEHVEVQPDGAGGCKQSEFCFFFFYFSFPVDLQSFRMIH